MASSREKQRIIQDSSEEEDGPDHYEKDGFVVDELEEEEEEDIEVEEARPKKQRKKKRPRRLDREDVELIRDFYLPHRTQEERPNKYRRLKRTTTTAADYSPENEYLLDSPTAEPVGGSLYDDDDEGRFDYGYDDYEADSNTATVIEAARSSKAAQAFGDASEYIFDDEEEQQQASISSIIEPSELVEHFMTEEAEIIRSTDCPERLQKMGYTEKIPSERELQEEADWIAPQVKQVVDQGIILSDTIFEVLRSLRIDFLEVPYIQTYQKNIFDSFKNLDLWQIVDLDEKWRRFYTMRQQFIELLEETKSTWSEGYFDYISHLQRCKTEEEVADIQRHFLLYYPSIAVFEGTHKPPELRGFYYDCTKHNIDQMITKIGLSVKDFGEKLIGHSDMPVNDYYESPEDCAINYVSESFSTTEMVLGAFRYVAAQQIAHDITIKQFIRDKMQQNGVISTEPTALGKLEIDEQHQLRCVKRLLQKPIDYITRDGQAAFLIQGLTSKLITVQLDFPDRIYDGLTKQMYDAYLSPNSDELARQWNRERTKIIKQALNRNLLPQIRKEILEMLATTAREEVLKECEVSLTNIAKYGPHNGKARTVVSVTWGPDSVKEPVIAVSVSRDGQYNNHLRLNHMAYNKYSKNRSKREENLHANQKKEDLKQLYDFIVSCKPSVIVVSANCLHARDLYNDIDDVLHDMRKEFESVAPVVWGSAVVPNLCSITNEYEQEFPHLTQLHRTGIALARMLQNPLPQLAVLFNSKHSITGIPLHPLQSIIDKPRIQRRLERVMVNYVNLTGVDINRSLRHKYLLPCLQFICGLGPCKADSLLQNIKRVLASTILDRAELSRHVGDIVNRNMIGFIRVSIDGVPEATEEPNVLHSTRIHPDHYEYAMQVISAVVKSYNKTEYDDEDDRVLQQFDELTPEEVRQELAEIDFQHDRNLSRIPVWLLQDIQTEIICRFKDPRESYTTLSIDELFTCITGETDLSLKKDQLVTGTVIEIIDPKDGMSRAEVVVRLDSGLTGTIAKSEISDTPPERLFDRVATRQAIQCRILDIDKAKFLVSLTSRSSELQKPPSYIDSYLKDEPKELPIRPISQTGNTTPSRSRPRMQKRMINHPLFKNMSFKEAEEYLINKGESGDLIFRPSSKGLEHLTLTYKFHNEIVHIDIEELDKVPDNPLVIGRTLKIKGQTFHDLNHIEAHYLDPILLLTQEMKSFRKFSEDAETVIEQDLKDIKHKAPASIPYKIGVSNEYPGRYVLYYVPNKSVRREYISCAPEGFRFRNRLFQSPGKLVDWFKQNWRGSGASRRAHAEQSASVTNAPYRAQPGPTYAFVNHPPAPMTNTPITSHNEWETY